MSRSASDATRFTATGPYASSKSFASSQPASKWPGLKVRSSQPSNSPPSNEGKQETAKQKVERLRSEARAKRIANSLSPMDRFIERGRSWADRFHRVAVFSLITASGIAGVLTVYSMSSLILYNRRQRELWIDKELNRLLDAKKAYVAGSATMEQLELLEKEKAGDEEKRMKEEIKKQTSLYKARKWLFDGLKSDNNTDQPGPLAAVSEQATPFAPEPPLHQEKELKAAEPKGDEPKSSRGWGWFSK